MYFEMYFETDSATIPSTSQSPDPEDVSDVSAELDSAYRDGTEPDDGESLKILSGLFALICSSLFAIHCS